MQNREDCGSSVRRTSVLTAAALTLVAAFGLAGVVVEARAATQTECVNEFNESDAQDNMCELETVSASGDECTLSGLCYHGGSWHDTSITLDLDDVDDLQNCSGALATSC